MLLHASRNLSPAGLGIGYQRKRIEQVRTLSVAGETPVQSSFFWRCAVGVAPQLWSSTSQEQQGRPQEKESRSCVAFNWKAIFQSLVEEREGAGGRRPHPLTGCTVTFWGGGVNRQSLLGKPRHGGWNDLD